MGLASWKQKCREWLEQSSHFCLDHPPKKCYLKNMNETMEKFVWHNYPHSLNIPLNIWTELESMYDSYQNFRTPLQLWMIDEEQANMVTFRLKVATPAFGIDGGTVYSVCFKHAHDATTFKLMWL